MNFTMLHIFLEAGQQLPATSRNPFDLKTAEIPYASKVTILKGGLAC